MQPYVLILVAVAFIVILVANAVFQQKRTKELAALANRLGFQFRPDRDEGFVTGWSFLHKLNVGSNRYAYNILEGHYEGHRVFIFDYHYRTGSGKNQHHHHVTAMILVLPGAFPLLTIGPEGVLSKIAQAFGYEDIDFESAEFSRAFCVRSPDKKFAYDVCNPRMIEFLLANRDTDLEIQGPALAQVFGSCLKPEQIEYNLRRLIEIRSRLPDYLFANA